MGQVGLAGLAGHGTRARRQVNEQTIPQTTEGDALAHPRPELIVAVLLFVGLYLWGLILSIQEMTQRESSGERSHIG